MEWCTRAPQRYETKKKVISTESINTFQTETQSLLKKIDKTKRFGLGVAKWWRKNKVHLYSLLNPKFPDYGDKDASAPLIR